MKRPFLVIAWGRIPGDRSGWYVLKTMSFGSRWPALARFAELMGFQGKPMFDYKVTVEMRDSGERLKTGILKKGGK